MLNITEAIRRTFWMLCITSLTALLIACTHPTPPAGTQSKSWVTENVAAKSTDELYKPFIGSSRFERSSSRIVDGYTIESGNLRTDESTGSLVTVRAKDGSLTAIVDTQGTVGVLRINTDGQSRFTAEKPPESILDGVVKRANDSSTVSPPAKPTAANENFIITVLVAYSRPYADRVVDARAYALAELETVNLALRNSLVTNVSLELAGITIVEADLALSPSLFWSLSPILIPIIELYNPDIVAGFFIDHDYKYAWLAFAGPNRITLMGYSTYFRAAVGVNAGAENKCSPNDPAQGYNFGYKTSIMCTEHGPEPFYSTPLVLDENGEPRGDAATADMARVWRENAQRMAHYGVDTPKNFRKQYFTPTPPRIVFFWDASPGAVGYEVYYTSSTNPDPVKHSNVTGTSFTAPMEAQPVRTWYVKAVSPIGQKSGLSNGAQ